MSARECQPCDSFQRAEWEEFGGVHQCLAPFDGTYPCGGTVRFCVNCNSDHHSGGYQTCAGSTGCRRNHPECLAAIAARCAR